MFPANVYRIMIGCPGDVEEEVRIAMEVVNRWNTIHAEQEGIVLLPLHWSTNSYPQQGDHPQQIINNQLVNKSDLLIAVFGARVGSPTAKAESGTIEEIEEHIAAGKPVMIFFRQVNDISLTTAADLAKLEEFKEKVKDQGLYKEYRDCSVFENVFLNSLELFLADHWLSNASFTSPQQEKVHFSDEEMDILREWVKSDNPDAHIVKYMGGATIIIGNSQFELQSNRDLVKWKDFLDRLQEVGFVEIDRYNNQRQPVYQLRMPAYDYFESLNK